MEQDHGPEKTRVLAKYIGTAAITKAIATEIVETLWGEAPLIEKSKAILLCQTYQLNPLMKHIYLIGYRHKGRDGKFVVDSDGEPVLDWSIQIGIGATRLMAQRKHNYSYLDMTPRKATKAEIEKILGDTADPECIYGFTHVRDVDTGAECTALRGIKTNENIKGTEKGNTHLNMACVRSERLCLDKQYPGEMPQGVEVVDERFIETDYRVVEETGGAGESPSKGGEKSGELGEEEQGQGVSGSTVSSSSKKAQKSKKIEASAAEGEGFSIDLDWLKESQRTLKWTDDTTLTFIIGRYKVSGTSVTGTLKLLTREQAEDFVAQINKRLEKQASLF